MTDKVEFGVGRVTRFYVPLLLQAFSQSLTYPLVAGIVTHGAYGVNELTAFSQGQILMFMIGALGAGLVTTGLVFAKTCQGYVSFRRLNALMMGALLALQCVPALAPLNRWIFEGVFGLPHDLAEISRWTMLAGVVMNGGFFLRNVPLVILFNNLESGKANNATVVRIVVTIACAVIFPRLGWTGAWWGLTALTLGVWAELLVTWLYACPYVRQLRQADDETLSAVQAPSTVALTFEQFRFTLPLALGGFLLAMSPVIIAMFVGRSAHATDMLAVHYVTIGVANPVAYAALRLQPVSIKFLPEWDGDRRLLVYAIVAGATLGLIPLAFATPTLGNWYFGVYQNLPARLVPTARLAIGIYAFISIIHAVRARIEGIAAAHRHPSAVMAGQIAYSVSLLLVCLALLPLGVPGWTLAISAIFVAPVCTTVAVYASLRLGRSDK